METLKKIVSNQYFPAAGVLTAVVLFWGVALVGGLSMLNDNNPPMVTLTWILFVYMAAVLTPIAGFMAARDLIRRYRLNRQEYRNQPAETLQTEDRQAETLQTEDRQQVQQAPIQQPERKRAA